MEAALHGHDAFSAHRAENKIAAVAFDCRDREVRYLAVWDVLLVGDMVDKVAESGSEDDCDAGHLALDLAAQIFGGLFDGFEHGVCCYVV